MNRELTASRYHESSRTLIHRESVMGQRSVVVVDGDPAVLGRLIAVLAPVDPDFDIVVP